MFPMTASRRITHLTAAVETKPLRVLVAIRRRILRALYEIVLLPSLPVTIETEPLCRISVISRMQISKLRDLPVW